MNPGGPGASGLRLADFVQSQLVNGGPVGQDLATRSTSSDSTRGGRPGTPIVCAGARGLDDFYGLDATPDDRSEQKELLDASRRFARQYRGVNGARLGQVGTVDVARDLDRIRATVGDERLNFLGWSYGTEIGTRYTRQFPGPRRPARARQQAVDPAIDIVEYASQQARALEASFARLVAEGPLATSMTRLPSGSDS